MAERSKEPTKFLLVGLTGVGVNYLVLFISLKVGLTDALALALAIIISMTSNYLLNRVWTFRSNNSIFAEYIRYALSNSAGAGIQYTVALFLEIQFERQDIVTFDLCILTLPTIYIASSVGIGLGFVTNYLFSKYFVFD